MAPTRPPASADQPLHEVSDRLAALPDPVALLEGLFAYAPVGFQIYKADGYSLITNRAFRDFFGSEPPPDYNVLQDDIAERAGVLELIRRAFAGETVSTPPIWYDPRELRRVQVKEAHRVGMAATFFPLFDRQGSVSHVGIAFRDVTAELSARDEAEARRADVESQKALLDRVIDQCGAGVVVADSSGTLRIFNAEAERQHGTKRAEVAAASWAEAFGPGTPLHRALHGEPVPEARWRVRRPDGSERVLSGSATPLTKQDGATAGAVLITRDETDRLKAEEALQFQAGVLRNVRNCIIVTDLDGKIAYWNEGAVAVFGYSAEEMLGKTPALLYPTIDPESLRRDLERVMAGEDHVGEWLGRRKDGRAVWVDVKTTLLKSVTGQPQGFIGVSEDITHRRRMQETAQFLSEATLVLASTLDDREAVARLARLAVPVLADFCIVDVCDEDRRIERIAIAHAVPEKQALLEELQRRFPPTWDSPQPAARVLRTGLPELLSEAAPEVRSHSYSEEHAALMHRLEVRSHLAVPIRVRDMVVGVISLGVSDSGRRYGREDLGRAEQLAMRAAQALDNARLYQEAQRAARLREEFLSIASHELNTPLASLKLQLQMLQRAARSLPAGGLSPEALGPRLQTMDRQLTRLGGLVSQLLDISRITAQRLSLEPEQVDLTQLVQEAIARSAEDAARAGSEVRLSEPGPVIGHWDRLRLDQVVSNLLSNAIKYGQGKPIALSIAATPTEVHLVVQDQGIGIAPEHQARIFGRFERAASERNYSGFGLGLWIVKQVIDAMGGTIEVRSVPQQGSTFEVRLPRGTA